MAESVRKVLVAVDGSEDSMQAFNWTEVETTGDCANTIAKDYINDESYSSDRKFTIQAGYCDNVCKSDDDCLVLNVTEFRSHGLAGILSDPGAYLEQLKQEQQATEKLTSGFANEMKQRGIKGTAYAVPGYSNSPAEEILSIAESKKVDLIVIGTQGLGKTSTSDFGSVCVCVLRYAKCPVLISRPDQYVTNHGLKLNEEIVESR